MDLGANVEWYSKYQHVPLYPLHAVEGMLARMTTVGSGEPVPLCGGELTATFTPSGHVLGACSILLEPPEGRVLFAGDYSLDRQLTVEGMTVPRLRPDVVLTESTYGNRLHADRSGEERLAATVLEVIEGGGKVLGYDNDSFIFTPQDRQNLIVSAWTTP